MNEHDGGDSQSQIHTHKQTTDVDMILETRIAHVMQKQASQVQFTPGQRARVMQRIATRPKHAIFSVPALVFVVSLVVILSFAVYLFSSVTLHPPVIATTQYVVSSSLSTPDALAHGGQLVSLDPTQHHLVYQASQGQGVMYTADVSNPAGSNLLAMRYARDVTWAPDGSALVTTIYPAGVIEPLLALVHTGQYMDTLGHAALASSWSPLSKQEIVYVTQEGGVTKLWSTPPNKGQSPNLIATLPIASLVQRLVWSPNGRELAFLTTTGQTPSPQSFSQPASAIYIMDMNTHNVHALPLPDHAALGNVVFSPNGQYLTYEQIRSQAPSVLHTLNIGKQQELFTITPHHTLLGWNWSSDSNTLIYSDGGVLAAHVLHGTPMVFPTTNVAYPLWLADGHILALSITHGVGKLEILARSTTK